MRFYSFLIILTGSVGSFVAKAQDTRNYSIQSTSYQQNNIDRNGNKYYIDSEGYPYYIDQSGRPYYIDENGDTYYADKNGNFYYLDSKGNPYYIDKNGQAYYLDKDGYIYYFDRNGIPYYIDKNGQPYYPNQAKESYYPKQQTKNYNDNIYPNSYRNSRAEMNNQREAVQPYYNSTDFDRFRLAVGGGYSYRLGERQKSSSYEIDQALKDLMHGFNIDADIQFFFNESMGIGVTTNYLQTSTSLYKTKQTFWYVGPSYVSKSDIGTSFSFFWNIGLGALFFKESSKNDYNYTKTAFAMNTGISGEYRINRNFGVGLKLSATYGTIGSINYGGYSYDLDERQNVSNLSLTGFISFRSK